MSIDTVEPIPFQAHRWICRLTRPLATEESTRSSLLSLPMVLALSFLAPAATAQSWEPAPPFPTAKPRLFATAVSHEGRIYVLGGSPFDSANDAPVHYLATGSSTWKTATSVEGPIVRQVAGVDSQGRIIVFAGRDGTDPEGDLGATYRYDPAEGQQGGVSQRSSLAEADHVAIAVDASSRLYSIGGGLGENATLSEPNSRHVERYDAQLDLWEPVADLPWAVADTAAAGGPGGILVAGGVGETGERLGKTALYDVASNSWSDAAVADLPYAISGARAVFGSDGRLYLIGGITGTSGTGTTSRSVLILDPGSSIWRSGPDLATPRSHFAAVRGDDDFLYALGGSNDAGGTNEVERLYTPPCPVFTDGPAPVDAWRGQTVELSAAVAGGPPLTYRWMRDGIDLTDGLADGGGSISGSETPSLRITAVAPPDRGDYALRVLNACGETTSEPAFLRVLVPPSIPASFEVTELHPTWALSSVAHGIAGGTIVGEASRPVPPYTSLARPVIWSAGANSAIDLTPSGSVGGSVAAATNGFQAGWWWWPYTCRVGGQWQTCYSRQACAWAGSATSHVNLQVSGWEYSRVSDIGGTTLVGTISSDDNVGNTSSHAGIWTAPNLSFRDIHPAGVSKSGADAVDGDRQYGWILTPYPGPIRHAAGWGGTRETFVDLHPPDASSSGIVAARDGQQVGWRNRAGMSRPTLWTDAPDTALDLMPPEADGAQLQDCVRGLQVGQVTARGVAGAAIWASSPDRCFDLHRFVPPEFLSSSARAIAVENDGAITIVGSGYNSSTQRTEALMWRTTMSPPPRQPNLSRTVRGPRRGGPWFPPPPPPNPKR